MSSRIWAGCLCAAVASAVVVALALPPTPACAGYGGGGGGGGGGGNQRKELPANVSVKVKRGDLVMRGSAGTILVNITPTASGLRIEGRGDTKINGGDEAFETDEVTGDWKLKFPRSRASELTVRPGDASALTPRIGKLTFVGGLRSELEIDGVDVTGDVKINMKRSLVDKGAKAFILHSKVGGDVVLSAISNQASLQFFDCQIDGSAEMRVRARKRERGSVPTMALRAIESDIGEIEMRTSVAGADVYISNVTLHGDCVLIGDHDVTVRDSHIGGDLTVKANLYVQVVSLVASVVDGTTTVVTGRGDDRVSAIDSALGPFELRTGSGNDRLRTERATMGAGSRFDASKGKADEWATTDASILTPSGVETVQPIAVE